MKKNKKAQAQVRNNYRNVDYPEVVDMDTLSYATDDELVRRQDFLFSERERYLREEVDVRPWESEICYVQRELKIRYVRRLAHDRYLNTQGAEIYQDKNYVN